ncbi:helix-turn-helix domain-containing protein [Lapillicoccus jejuensis]|uniref:Helix-turn-helix protein n=1 Tax=Lapillicoccus jejuensis TaxID=402171 RepID=A0A542E684_9MICO|nr:helix-turn-helix transcriptional regulator [Lapillicoccus jejuensis]TQJ10842.1 helix-turn-helix protein [Lapillicoccus jejuensis]
MSTPSPLGDHLRARRALVDPQDVGLPGGGRRRTPGLRREEVAMLAGISADYYLRLEQGRDRHPSAQVLDALARVLRLDASGTEYLHGLAGGPTRTTRRRDRPVPVGIRQLLESVNLPAFVESRRFDVLATNELAAALLGLRVGTNRLRTFFLEEADRSLFVEWDRQAVSFVAGFRASVGTSDDPEVARLVGDLSLRSETFRRLWARHDVVPLAGGVSLLQHPLVGRLELRREKLPLADTDGQILAIYHPERDSSSASVEGLALLASLTSSGGVATG